MKPSLLATCSHCTKSFLAPIKELNRDNAKFCSRACAAAYGNKLRKRTRTPNLKCALCDKEFYRKPSLIKSTKNYCSEGCFRGASGRTFSKEKILELIRDFAAMHDRIPIQAEFTACNGWVNPSTVVDHFSSRNKAIEEAGFLPNPASIGYVCYAKDGHLCRSYSELIIDDWFTGHDIEHEKEVRCPGSKLVADWKISNVFIEYLGMGMKRNNRISKRYIETLDRKRNGLQYP